MATSEILTRKHKHTIKSINCFLHGFDTYLIFLAKMRPQSYEELIDGGKKSLDYLK